MNIRLLRESDLPDLMTLKESANWNQTAADWLMLLRYEPEGCFGIEIDGRVVSSGAASCYGTDMAWISMVLTLPEYRGRGYARGLMDVAVEYAQRHSRAVRLDASEFGRPLYESMGFVAECYTERWMRLAGPAEANSVVVEELSWDRKFDTEVFGADRTRILTALAAIGSGASVSGGYAFSRPGTTCPFFGPCVATSPEAARQLMAWFVSQNSDVPAFTDLFPHHQDAVQIASEFGFAPARRLTRMVLKPAEPALPDARVYATGSFSWG